ncbi:MAG: DUF2793 domain-containing protein [Pseudomonadota bacterium]
MSNSLNLELPYVEGSQSQKHVTVNEAFRRIDSVVQLAVLDRTLTAPPVSPVEGDRYIIAGSPTGIWTGRATEIAAFQDGAWVYFAPRAGWTAYNEAESALLYFDGASWEILTAVGELESVAKVGVNSAADVTNRLVVQSESALFTADTTQPVPTGDMRVKVNKTGDTDTAAHLFQRGYSGRAEFGLLGSDDFSLKVSADGSSFNEVLRADRSSLRLDLAAVPLVGGGEGLVHSFADRGAAGAAAIDAGVQRIEVRGYAAENDGGAAVFARAGSLPADGLGFQDGAGGFWSLVGDAVSLKQAGAVGDGTTDDTVAVRRAFASGRNISVEEGAFFITDDLVTSADAQRVIGVGRQRAVFVVDATFRLAATAVFRIVHNNVTFQDFTVRFDQSAASSRATLVQYPPVVDLQGMTRIRLTALRFEAAFDGVIATGNAGGAIFEDLEIGTFNLGLQLGGSLDTVEMRNCRVWPYGFAFDTALVNIYSDGTNIGFRIGRVDDFKMTNCTPFRSKLIFEASNGFKPFGTVQGLALDGSFSSIEFLDGEIAISSLYATTAEPNDVFIHQTGGTLVVSDFSFKVNNLANVPLVQVDGASANCLMQNGRVLMGANPGLNAFQVDSGVMTVSAVDFQMDNSGVRTGAAIRQTGGRLIAFGNHVNARSIGQGSFILVDTDDDHLIFGNDSNGWDLTFPTSPTSGGYGPNHSDGRMLFHSQLQIGPRNTANNGGSLLLEGAGVGNTDITLENQSGELRVTTDDGSSVLTPSVLEFLNGDNNTGLGRNALLGAPGGVSNVSALGNGATVTGSNQVQLGNSATTVFAYGAVQNRSDARDKVDVRETLLGLDFVNALRPVDFRWNYREDYSGGEPDDLGKVRGRFHHGFLAQDVAALIEDTGLDFGGYQDHQIAGGSDVKSLGYSEMIAPLVKAVQELSARLSAVESGAA